VIELCACHRPAVLNNLDIFITSLWLINAHLQLDFLSRLLNLTGLGEYICHQLAYLPIDVTALLERLCSSPVPTGFRDPAAYRIIPSMIYVHASIQTEGRLLPIPSVESPVTLSSDDDDSSTTNTSYDLSPTN
ncbi:hypothetical protein AMELA_G00272900, partial [Ameiurus melas]